MRKLILPIAVIAAIAFSSCGSKGWTDDSRKKFTDMCVEKLSGVVGEDGAAETCKCSLEKIEKEYPSYEDADQAGNEEKIAELIQGCLKM